MGSACYFIFLFQYEQIYVFEPEQDYFGSGFLGNTATIAQSTIYKYGENFTSEEAIQYYYKTLIGLDKKKTDEKGIIKLLNEGGNKLEFSFEEISDKFKLIEESGYPVIVDTEESQALLKEISYCIEEKNGIISILRGDLIVRNQAKSLG